MAREFGDTGQELLALCYMANACLRQDDLPGAYSRLMEASEMDIPEDSMSKMTKYDFLYSWICYHLQAGDFEAARKMFDPVLKDWQDGEYVWPFYEVEINRIRAEIEKGEQGQPDHQA